MTQGVSAKQVNGLIGGAFLFTGAALSCLVFADRWAGLRLPLPGVWYETRGLHVLLCVGFYVAGWLTLRNTSEQPVDEDETQQLYETVRFYTRPDCCLCDEAKSLLVPFVDELPEIESINIDNDRELTERFSDCVPVIELDGRIMFKGRISRALLEREFDARRRSQKKRSTPIDSKGDA